MALSLLSYCYGTQTCVVSYLICHNFRAVLKGAASRAQALGLALFT